MIAALRAQIAGTAEIDWRDPLRMSIAALLAYAAATALHLPEAFWAVLSALVVSRPHRGGTMQAGVGRFAGTLAGVAWAMVVAAGRHWMIEGWQVHEIWLLLALLAPLTALVAWRADYRTAPIAAVIVLSAAPHGDGAPLAAAALRLAEITLGAGTGMAVAWLLLPAGSLRRTETLAARLLDALAGLLEGEDPQGTAGRRPLDACRRLLQHLTAASRAAPWEGGDHARAEQLAALAARLHSDVAFLRRCLAAKATTTADEQRIEACRTALRSLAMLLRGQDPMPQPTPAVPSPQTTATGELLAMLEQDIAALARLVATPRRKKWRLPKQPR
ncbi:FUSC family protein [Ferrovibrio xuzhouensis]|uniref:FUSC family protein n=1 Tax=Ferrovibrio xuzhouensis TaxID=1576914 RepID=A0ABV7VD90_9PROT